MYKLNIKTLPKINLCQNPYLSRVTGSHVRKWSKKVKNSIELCILGVIIFSR